MEFLIMGRQEGKTAAMLEWMRSAPEGEHRICVSHSEEEAMRLLRENPDLESWQFVSINEVGRGSRAFSGVLYGRGGRVVLGVDNLDLILHHFFKWPVDFLTATGSLADTPTMQS